MEKLYTIELWKSLAAKYNNIFSKNEESKNYSLIFWSYKDYDINFNKDFIDYMYRNKITLITQFKKNLFFMEDCEKLYNSITTYKTKLFNNNDDIIEHDIGDNIIIIMKYSGIILIEIELNKNYNWLKFFNVLKYIKKFNDDKKNCVIVVLKCVNDIIINNDMIINNLNKMIYKLYKSYREVYVNITGTELKYKKILEHFTIKTVRYSYVYINEYSFDIYSKGDRRYAIDALYIDTYGIYN